MMNLTYCLRHRSAHRPARHLSQRLLSLLLLISASLLPTAHAATPATVLQDGLKIELSAQQSSYSATDAILINFTISNQSNASLRFLPWKTPLENPFRANILDVRQQGKRLDYLGKVIRRAPPKPEQFISLSPGESRNAQFDLTDFYPLGNAGSYTVQLRSELLHLHLSTEANSGVSSASNLPVPIQSNQITISLSQTRAKKRTLVDIAAALPAYSGCSTDNITKLNAAHILAAKLTEESRNALQNTTSDERASVPRYKKWFGTYTAALYNRVNNGFSLMHAAFENQEVKYHCDCTAKEESDGVLAYVFPNSHYNVHICDTTYSLDITGSDTQAGTIIHEMSHFLVIASTDDHAYGITDAANLAISNPTNATDNAENYLFFAENFPFLKMGKNVGNHDITGPMSILLL